ncbi:hypothetical protein AB0I61_33005 [Polymorphospora rubra]|uniref:hypothetical protein n=1 Tax=Polymorphospora rubra TaxID=338584 RepID=UPI0033C2E3D9
MPTDHTRSAQPGSGQPPVVTDRSLLLGDGRIVIPRHIGGEYSLCELLHEPHTSDPATTQDGLDRRNSRPAGSLIPLPNKTLTTAAPASPNPHRDADTSPIMVMADYESFPLWRQSPTGAVNLDPLSLPISAELAQGLMCWAATYGRTLRRDDPAASGFTDPAAEERFHLEGEELANRLRAELHGTCPVDYHHGHRPTKPATGPSNAYQLALAGAGIPAPQSAMQQGHPQ